MLSPMDDVELDASKKVGADIIRWNLDMKVTVSNVKNSKFFPRLRTSFIVVLMIVFIVLVSLQRMEVQALRVQTHRMNVNALRLMSKYDKLNRHVNRVWSHRTSRYYDPESSIGELSDRSQIYRNDRDSDTVSLTSRSDRTTSSGLDRSIDRQNDVIVNNTSVILDNVTTPLARSNSDPIVDPNEERNYLRSARALLTFETRNYTATEDERSVDGDGLSSWREPRAERLRRDQGRGKKRRQNRRRPKRGRGRLGPLVATFVGAVPEQHFTGAAYIGPWIKSDKNDSQYGLNKFHLVENKMSIEVTTSGLYMISVQIHYFGEPMNYSYWVLLNSEGVSTTQKLTKCATASSRAAAEVSCFTSVVTYLQKGDRVRIQQQEKDRLVNMREGYSYIQLMLLASNAPREHTT